MGTLTINYSQLNNAKKYADNASKSLENYSQSISNRITKKIGDLGYTSSNKDGANWLANQKIKKLNEKSQSYARLSKNIDEFKQYAKAKDKEVSDIFKDMSKSFTKSTSFKAKPISSFFSALAIGAINSTDLGKWINNLYQHGKDFVSSAKDKIKNWYNYSGGEYVVDIVISGLAIAAGVVAIAGATLTFVGICAAIAGGFMILNGVFDIIYSCIAKYNNNDPVKAAKLGKIDKFSDHLKNRYDNKAVTLLANGLNVVEGFVGIVGITNLLHGTFNKSTNFKAFKNLFSTEKGLGSKFLSYNSELQEHTYKFGNLFKGTVKLCKDKTFRKELIKTFKRDVALDMHLMGNKIKSFKDNFIYMKDLSVDTISNIKNKNLEDRLPIFKTSYNCNKGSRQSQFNL